MAGAETLEIGTMRTIYMFLTAFYAVGSYILACYLSRRGRNLAKVEKWVLAWLIFNVLLHFTMDFTFVIISLARTSECGEESKHIFSNLWKEYAKPNERCLKTIKENPTEFLNAIVSCLVGSVLCPALIHAIMKRKFYRYFMQIVVSTWHLYACWMHLARELLSVNPNLDTSDPLFVCVYMQLLRAIFIVAPVAMLYKAWKSQRR